VEILDRNGHKIEIPDVQHDDFLSLIKQYDIHVTRLCKEIQSLSTKPTWNAKFVLKAIKGLWEFKLIAQNLFQELRRMNVYTIDGPTDHVFVRTTIELDADILTILTPELANRASQRNTLLFYLHRCNVYLANLLFVYRVNRFFSNLKIIVNTIKIISVPLWVIPYLSSHFPIPIDPFSIAVQVINLVGVPALLVRFIVHKVFQYIIKHRVLGNLLL
jgi:hypothetical protein